MRTTYACDSAESSGSSVSDPPPAAQLAVPLTMAVQRGPSLDQILSGACCSAPRCRPAPFASRPPLASHPARGLHTACAAEDYVDEQMV